MYVCTVPYVMKHVLLLLLLRLLAHPVEMWMRLELWALLVENPLGSHHLGSLLRYSWLRQMSIFSIEQQAILFPRVSPS